MATAVWALSCAGAAAKTEAMPIVATVKYSLALSLMGALLVRMNSCVVALVGNVWIGSPCALGKDSAQSMSPRNKPRCGPRFGPGGSGVHAR
jgi:hypothetical protein